MQPHFHAGVSNVKLRDRSAKKEACRSGLFWGRGNASEPKTRDGAYRTATLVCAEGCMLQIGKTVGTIETSGFNSPRQEVNLARFLCPFFKFQFDKSGIELKPRLQPTHTVERSRGAKHVVRLGRDGSLAVLQH